MTYSYISKTHMSIFHIFQFNNIFGVYVCDKYIHIHTKDTDIYIYKKMRIYT